jgi:hypothetical protein
MVERVSYYWQIDDLRERLVGLQWSPAPPDADSSAADIYELRIRVERIANPITVQIFRHNVSGQPFPDIRFEEIVENDGKLLRRREWITKDSVVATMNQRRRQEGEPDWADGLGPNIDELVFTCKNVEFP